MRRTGCTPVTTHRTSNRCLLCGHGCSYGGVNSSTPRHGSAKQDCRMKTNSRTCASTSTSLWPAYCLRVTTLVGDESALDRAIALLGRLRAAAVAGDRVGTEIEILVVLALARQASGDPAAALDALRRAVTLGHPEGYVRVFADEGAPLVPLLKSLRKQSTDSDAAYVRRVLAATDRVRTSDRRRTEPAHRATFGARAGCASVAGHRAQRPRDRPKVCMCP